MFAKEAVQVVEACLYFMASWSKAVILVHILCSPYKTDSLNSCKAGWAQEFLIFFLNPVIAAVTLLWLL